MDDDAVDAADAAPPAGRKRHVPPADAEPASTPASAKRRRLDDAGAAQSPSTPRALGAIASAISGVLGLGNQQQQQRADADGAQAPAPSPARPALKLAALKGTKWDRGDIGSARLARQPAATPTRAAARPGGRPSPSPAKTRSRARRGGAAADAERPSDGRHEPDPVGGPTSSPAVKPRSILTPSKKSDGPPKSVTFGGALDQEVYFEDLPKSPKASKAPKSPKSPKAKAKACTPKKTRASKRKRAAEDEADDDDDDDDDDVRCGVCSKADSRPPNEIILCDNCDFAAHQACYDVPEIPEGDWLCKSCTQEDVLRTPVKPADAARTGAAAASQVPDIANLDEHLRSLQRVLLDRCCGRRRIRMMGQEESYDKVRQLVEQTIVAGEGNSMLLAGPRGCGKTTMVENIILDLSREHRHLFHVVRLSGFIHTDDKLALKEIWRQLGKEMEVEDDLVSRANYADTMASLLALLSHPSEITGADEGVTSQSVVFVIDEFDMFAYHARQTLLYNLFDVAQSRKAPVAVLGCTTRLDVVEMLEKRVKSRFSHRCVYLSPPRSLPAFWQACRQGLTVDKADAGAEGIDAGLEGYDEFHEYWTRGIEELYKQRPFQDLLQYHYLTTKSPGAFLAEWVLPLSRLSAAGGGELGLRCPASAGAEATSLAAPESRLQLLSTLSELDLGLLIAAARLDAVAHAETVNFAMAYDEYGALVGRQRAQSATSGMLVAGGGGARVWSRGVAAVAWERLISLGVLAPAGAGRGALGQGGLGGRMWRVEVTLEEIPSAVGLSAVQARWCREV